MEKENLVVGDRVEWVTGTGNTLSATVTAVPANEWDDEVEVEIYYEDDPDNCDDPSEVWEPGDSYTTMVSASRLSLIELAGERRGGVMNDLEVQTVALRAILSPEIEAAWARMRVEDDRARANNIEPEYDVRDERLDQIACMISVADDMLDHQWRPNCMKLFWRSIPISIISLNSQTG